MRTTTLNRRPANGSATVTSLDTRRTGRPASEPDYITEDIREGGLVADYRQLIRNMSQEEMAGRLGIARSTLAQYEKGFRHMPDERVEQIASILGIHTWKLRIIQTLPLDLKVA